jgi:translation elongation factor aEF-1 beta
MGNVLVTYRIMPEGTEVSTSGLKAQIEAIGKAAKRVEVAEEPFAFGLKVLVAKFIVEDGSGLADKLEESLNKLPGVSSVECTELGLI